MKLRVEVDQNLPEDEVIIRCRELNETVLALQRKISVQLQQDISLIGVWQNTEYYLHPADILFFETESKVVFAHTAENLFETEYKLYELEEELPGYFMRISKSAIVNLNHIYSIAKNVTGASAIEFVHSHKRIYVSRMYYKALKERMAERRRG